MYLFKKASDKKRKMENPMNHVDKDIENAEAPANILKLYSPVRVKQSKKRIFSRYR